MEAEAPAEAVCVMLLEAGERLLAALREERRLWRVASKQDMPVDLAAARKRVDECADQYCRALEACGFPDAPIRHLVECNVSDG
jgi:hypothetical protein